MEERKKEKWPGEVRVRALVENSVVSLRAIFVNTVARAGPPHCMLFALLTHSTTSGADNGPLPLSFLDTHIPTPCVTHLDTWDRLPLVIAIWEVLPSCESLRHLSRQ